MQKSSARKFHSITSSAGAGHGPSAPPAGRLMGGRLQPSSWRRSPLLPPGPIFSLEPERLIDMACAMLLPRSARTAHKACESGAAFSSRLRNPFIGSLLVGLIWVPAAQTVVWVPLLVWAGLGDLAFSISARHKLKNALMMIGTIGPLDLAGLAATYASTCRTRSVSVELARHRWKVVLTG